MRIHNEAPCAEEAFDDEPVYYETVSIHEVVNRYHGSLIKFLRQRLRVSEDAHDVAQEAYIRLMKYEGSREIRSSSSMLFRIALNVAHDLGRASQVRHANDHVSINDMDIQSEAPSIERVLAAEQRMTEICKTIERLPPKCRQVFLLSRFHGMTYSEIAAHCGISVKMVEKHISHALAVCVSKVGRDDQEES